MPSQSPPPLSPQQPTASTKFRAFLDKRRFDNTIAPAARAYREEDQIKVRVHSILGQMSKKTDSDSYSYIYKSAYMADPCISSPCDGPIKIYMLHIYVYNQI